MLIKSFCYFRGLAKTLKVFDIKQFDLIKYSDSSYFVLIAILTKSCIVKVLERYIMWQNNETVKGK